MAKENINSKSSTCVFLDWTHKTNRQTRHMVKQNIHSKSSTRVFLDWTHKSYGQTKYSFTESYMCLFRLETQDKQDIWSNKILIQRVLHVSFYNGHTGQTDKQHVKSKHSTHVFL